PSGPGRLSGRPQSIATIWTGVSSPLSFYAIRLLAKALLHARLTADKMVISSTYLKSPSCVRPQRGVSRTVRVTTRLQRCRLPLCTQAHNLLELDLGADLLEGGFDLLGLVLRNAFLDGLRRRLDQVLGFLQAQTRGGTHLFNDLDLLVANRGQHDR